MQCGLQFHQFTIGQLTFAEKQDVNMKVPAAFSMRAVVDAYVVSEPKACFVSLPAFPGDQRRERGADSIENASQRIAGVVRQRQREQHYRPDPEVIEPPVARAIYFDCALLADVRSTNRADPDVSAQLNASELCNPFLDPDFRLSDARDSAPPTGADPPGSRDVGKRLA